MDADIKFFVNGITEKTGISFSVYGQDGNFIAGDKNLGDTVLHDFEGVISDEQNKRTLFTIKYKSKCFIGAISGTGESERNYAFLIGELAENSFFKESGLSRAEFLKAILLGEANYSQINRYMRKYGMEDLPAFVMIVSVNSGSTNDVMDILKNYASGTSDFVVKIDETLLALVKFIDEESNEYHSSTEYAEFLIQSVYEETGVTAKISIGGTVKTVSDLSTSYAQAMTAVRMSNTINSKGDVHSFKEYVLIKMLEDMPKYKLNEYLETLMDSGAREIFSDEEMTNTAEEFLENSLNVSETSRKLYLHRNTLTYRLDKIEKATGLNIRKFSDAVTFRLITILSKLVR